MTTPIQIGDQVVTETFDLTARPDGWKSITGTRFLRGTVVSIDRDKVTLDTAEGQHVTLIGQVERC